MSFKKINKENIENVEKNFLNNARGDNKEYSKESLSSINKKPFNKNGNLKRKYSISFYIDEKEFLEIKTKAEEYKMNMNQYIRFKVFNTNSN